ncbi:MULTISPECIES: EcsC family protein [unclassified Bacillus (in: firmicutes)]|uniref:EcsC family protein n=1 Tax=unclassified Bacillus (in: firmicutes) TaxID=185979 RepID=UPI0008EDC455|nr:MULTISPECIES: EcsC family protein [unclassified Bacillus (in: firmicutes)]SFB11883.1 EcsC protein family protein [Bacillus sp. UNCCL13]SFQ90397.1 EcsC protein family protein [Bacillus sp. cl95]
MESREELMSQLQLIEKWEKDQSDLWIWERLGRLPFKILDKITPKFIHQKIGTLLDEIGGYIQTGGSYLIRNESIYKEIEKEISVPITSVDDMKEVPLAVMEKVTGKIVGQRKKFATLQGATTGFGGIFTLAIDIPAILAISLKTLQEIAIIHGYDPNEKNERIFIVKCLQFSSADIVGKRAILNGLNEQGRSGEMMSELQGWREVVYTYRDQFGWKKLFQMVPVAGLIFGAFTNRSMINDLAEVGTMLYRKRRIMDRLSE